jgi:hypothetical protein
LVCHKGASDLQRKQGRLQSTIHRQLSAKRKRASGIVEVPVIAESRPVRRCLRFPAAKASSLTTNWAEIAHRVRTDNESNVFENEQLAPLRELKGGRQPICKFTIGHGANSLLCWLRGKSDVA